MRWYCLDLFDSCFFGSSGEQHFLFVYNTIPGKIVQLYEQMSYYTSTKHFSLIRALVCVHEAKTLDSQYLIMEAFQKCKTLGVYLLKRKSYTGYFDFR